MIHFVGAGPGAVDLITVRGQKLLKEADVIIYAGSLVNPQLLQERKANCEVYDSAYMTLEEVIAVMEQAECQGKETVRLHTGDPSIYGAIREQMDLLEQKGITYESCPGVSSFCGAAAALNMEYTLPGISQSVILTRMEGATKVPEGEQIEKLAAHHTTMVLFLSTGMLSQLAEKLIAGGYAADTPAALVYKATWPEEKKIIATLETLPKLARAAGISKTALIIVGNVVGKSGYEKSRLYAADFSTAYRKASK